MSYEEIAKEALERAEKATEGPYEVRYYEWTDGGVRLASKGLSAPSDSIAFHASNYPKGTKRGRQDMVDMEYIAYACNNVSTLARAVLELAKLQETIERQQSELRIEKASQATRGNA